MANVIVVGSINMDIVALASKHPRGGETVNGSELHLLPGGKGANQAVAARRGGAHTRMIGRLGDDPFADELRQFLSEEDISISEVRSVAGLPSGTALITVANGENTIVVVPGANADLSPADVIDLSFEAGDIVLAQFEVLQPTITAAFEVAHSCGASTILNAAPAEPCDRHLLELTDILIVNETELCTLRGEEAVEEMSAKRAIAGARDLRVDPSQTVIVTLGAAGAVAVSAEETVNVGGLPVEAIDTTGAGDCFVGNLAAELSRGSTLETAMGMANRAASLCVQVLGAGVSMPRLDATAELI